MAIPKVIELVDSYGLKEVDLETKVAPNASRGLVKALEVRTAEK
jgi:hypothetical protein